MAATPTVASPRAIAAAAPSAATARSTSSGPRTAIPGKVATIEYDPNRTTYIALLHYADGEKSYILAPTGVKVGDTVESGPGADIRAGNALPLAQDPDRHRRPQRRAQARPGRPHGPRRRHRDPGRRQGRRHGDAAPAVLGDADGPRRVPGDDRNPFQRRAPERRPRQGRPQPPQGQAPAEPRYRDEPGRPPARRRRGPQDPRRPPEDAVGQADARLPDPQEEQAVQRDDRPRSPARQEEGR